MDLRLPVSNTVAHCRGFQFVVNKIEKRLVVTPKNILLVPLR